MVAVVLDGGDRVDLVPFLPSRTGREGAGVGLLVLKMTPDQNNVNALPVS